MSAGDKPKCVPLLVLGGARRRMLQDRLTTIVRGWHKAWASEGIAEPTVTLAADPISREPRGGTVTILGLREGAPVIYANATADVARLLGGVGAPEGALAAIISPADGLSLSLAEGVVRGLCSEIVKAGFPNGECVLERQRVHFAHGPGTASRDRNTHVSLTFGKARPPVEFSLAPELVDALLGSRPTVSSTERLTSRRNASSEERVRVSAMLGTAVVSWRELTALAAGNVLVLDQTLDSSCALLVSGKGKLGDAQVGAVNGALAVQITRVTAGVAGSHSI
jgi:Na+(H+)/acetate symporter ActP